MKGSNNKEESFDTRLLRILQLLEEIRDALKQPALISKPDQLVEKVDQCVRCVARSQLLVEMSKRPAPPGTGGRRE